MTGYRRKNPKRYPCNGPTYAMQVAYLHGHVSAAEFRAHCEERAKKGSR